MKAVPEFLESIGRYLRRGGGVVVVKNDAVHEYGEDMRKYLDF